MVMLTLMSPSDASGYNAEWALQQHLVSPTRARISSRTATTSTSSAVLLILLCDPQPRVLSYNHLEGPMLHFWLRKICKYISSSSNKRGIDVRLEGVFLSQLEVCTLTSMASGVKGLAHCKRCTAVVPAKHFISGSTSFVVFSVEIKAFSAPMFNQTAIYQTFFLYLDIYGALRNVLSLQNI